MTVYMYGRGMKGTVIHPDISFIQFHWWGSESRHCLIILCDGVFFHGTSNLSKMFWKKAISTWSRRKNSRFSLIISQINQMNHLTFCTWYRLLIWTLQSLSCFYLLFMKIHRWLYNGRNQNFVTSETSSSNINLGSCLICKPWIWRQLVTPYRSLCDVLWELVYVYKLWWRHNKRQHLFLRRPICHNKPDPR